MPISSGHMHQPSGLVRAVKMVGQSVTDNFTLTPTARSCSLTTVAVSICGRLVLSAIMGNSSPL